MLLLWKMDENASIPSLISLVTMGGSLLGEGMKARRNEVKVAAAFSILPLAKWGRGRSFAR
jgi:hypothetical protein